jgi:antirestriction protein
MSPKRTNSDGPRIYVADLAAYNAGTLHGRWIDADQDPDEIRAEIQEMLAESPVPGGEEYAIHDYEGFGRLRLNEYDDINTVARIAKLIEEHGALATDVIAHFGGAQYLADAERALDEEYQGSYDRLADWAEELAESTGAEAETYRSYIDWEAVARDAELNGDIFTVETDDGKVHVFWSH